MNAPWDEEENGTTRTRERPEVDIDLEPTAIVHRTQQHGNRPELDFAALCSLAQSMGPRDRTEMLAMAREVGAMLGAQLNDDGHCAAYYSWEQSGKLIEGPTVDLMEALAEVWGRTVKSVELVHQGAHDVVLIGVVMDLLTLVVTRRPFVSALMPAPAKFRKSAEQTQRWNAMQLQSATSKAIRGALEHALPAWLQKAAVDAGKVAHARAVLGEKTLGEVIGKATDHLREKYGLDEGVLVAWLDEPRHGWTLEHVARLRSLATELKDGRRTPAKVRAEAASGAEQQQEPASEADRLAGLGLGLGKAPEQTAPANGTPPPPSPAAHGGNGDQASGGGSAAAKEPAPAVSPEWTAAREKLRKAEKALPDEVSKPILAEYQLGKAYPNKTPVNRMLACVVALENARTRLDEEAAAKGSTGPDQAEDGPSGDKLLAECRGLMEHLDDDGELAALTAAGIPESEWRAGTVGAEPLRRLLEVLVAELEKSAGGAA